MLAKRFLLFSAAYVFWCHEQLLYVGNKVFHGIFFAEAQDWNSLAIDEKLLKIPTDVAGLQVLIVQLFFRAKELCGARTIGLEKGVKWVFIETIHFRLLC